MLSIHHTKTFLYFGITKDWDKSGMIGQSEFLHLLVRINVYIKKELACRLFSETAGQNLSTTPCSNSPEVTFNQCIGLLRKIKRDYFHGNQVRDQIFDSVFGADKDEVTANEFLSKFLHGTQNDTDATIEDVKQIFGDLNSMEILRAHHEINERSNNDSIDRLLFEEYLMSYHNDVYDIKKKQFDILSLNEPLSHYWINTSHNTYLVSIWSISLVITST